MRWRDDPAARGYLNEAKEKLALAATNQNVIERCGGLCGSLNKSWTAYRRAIQKTELSDNKALFELLWGGLSERAKLVLCGTELDNIAMLNPPILNHDGLKNDYEYDPRIPPSPALIVRHSEAHKEFNSALRNWRLKTTNETHRALIKKLAALIYVVRSNIAHDEKSPRGPDLGKFERDRAVCAALEPTIALAAQLAFGGDS